jgi:hypothetical protein
MRGFYCLAPILDYRAQNLSLAASLAAKLQQRLSMPFFYRAFTMAARVSGRTQVS